jgi:hypothetical protein
MKPIQASPGATRLIESLRDIGYEFKTAIADIVDNSIIADASEVHVDIYQRSQKYPKAHVIIADNGNGMDRTELIEAMRFGSKKEYSDDDLGKYGLGLKTASLSQCNNLTVSSKPVSRGGHRSNRCIMRWDMEHVRKKDDWEILALEREDLRDWEWAAIDHEVAKENGNVVLWSGVEDSLPLLEDDNFDRRDRFLGRLIADLEIYLGMVFHRFIQKKARGRKKLDLFVCGKKVKPWDPYCLELEKTKELETQRMKISVGGGKKETVIIQPYILPRKDEFPNNAAHYFAGGPNDWNAQQVFYFYRNDRLLQAGGWSYMRAPDEHTKLLRIAVDFPSSLDKAFSININKMRSKIPDAIRPELEKNLSNWVKKARIRYDKGGRASSSNTNTREPAPAPTDRPTSLTVGGIGFSLNTNPSSGLVIVKGDKTNPLRVLVPSRHEAAAIFASGDGDKAELRRLCLAVIGILDAIHEGKMKPSDIPIDNLRKSLRKFL